MTDYEQSYENMLAHTRVKSARGQAHKLYAALGAEVTIACEARDWDTWMRLIYIKADVAGLLGSLGCELPSSAGPEEEVE
jgi:hypothetical protein